MTNSLKTWWKRRSYEFKGGAIGSVITVLSVVIMSSVNILPGNFLRILEPANYTTFGSGFKIIVFYYSILTLLGTLIGFIIGKTKRRNRP